VFYRVYEDPSGAERPGAKITFRADRANGRPSLKAGLVQRAELRGGAADAIPATLGRRRLPAAVISAIRNSCGRWWRRAAWQLHLRFYAVDVGRSPTALVGLGDRTRRLRRR